MVIAEAILDEMTDRVISRIRFAVIHHTVMLPTTDIEEVSAADQGLPLSLLCVGYNAYVKCTDVAKDQWEIQEGRPLGKLPAAQYGLNGPGYAIAFGGNYQNGAAPFTTPVSENALKLAAAHLQEVASKATNMRYLIGHRDVAAIAVRSIGGSLDDYGTLCPGDNLYARLHDLRLLCGLKEWF